MTQNNNLMPSALDRQLSNPEHDAFGHRHFAQAIRSIIESDKHDPPFSIGLLGGWGTGKSTIKELYIQNLQDDTRKNEAGRTRSDRIHSITFNAWRFGGKEQDIKRALLRHVFLELGGDDESLNDRLFRQISEFREIPKKHRQYTWEILKAWAMPVPAFLLSLALLYSLLFLIVKFIPLQDDLSRSIIGVAFIGAFSYLLKQIKAPPVAAHRTVTSIALPSMTAEQYEDLLLDQISKFKAGESTTPSSKGGKFCERIVVFVDDLDRLSAEEMVQGLDAVRTFMEIPDNRLPKSLGLVFVISCDESKVADALAKGRRQGDLPGTVFTQSDARRYLDRIFQFRLEIPPFPRHDMRQYAIKQMNELPSIAEDLRTRGVPVETVVDRMVHIGVQDPRNALQIVNAFAQAWWLAKKRETEELGTGRPGGLHEGAVTGHPVSLGAISAIKVSFPDFYRDLQNDPSFLHRITDVLIRRKSIEDQPLSAQQTLIEKYVKRRDDGAIEVRPEHRPLRQFLASIVGLRWPNSLQSLLLLSEDPVTRKFGSKARNIYDAFVSGDTQGVLDGFGRHIDSTPIKSDEALLLYQMSDELRHESDARRINASRVIADLVDRLPQNTAYQLIGSLCRELGDSGDLRSQLGIQKISKVLAVAHHDDQRTIASRLVEDVLTIGEDTRLRLETMETPDLDEAVKFTRTTVSMVLPIRRKLRLDPSSDSQLLSWLVDRTVRVGGKSFQLPFLELEQWMDDHEDHLLPDLTHHYSDLIASELEADKLADFDTAQALTRVKKVFATLWAAGQETRQILWSDATRYVALQLPDASQVAWEVVAEHLTSPDTAQISKFIEAFIERLKMEATDEKWALDLESATQALLSIIRTRLADLSETTRSHLSDLAILWSKDDDGYVTHSCNVVRELKQTKEGDANPVFENWAQRILKDLPLDCVKLLASTFPTLTEATQTIVINQLQPIITTDTFEEMAGKRHCAFAESVPQEAWNEAPLKGYLDKLLPQVAARANNPNNYLVRIFPPIAPVLHHASRGIVGQSLHTLFSQAKNHPKHYAYLHSLMVGHWPKPSPDLNPYNPEQIFREGQAFAMAQPTYSSRGLLGSLRDMLNRELVPGENRPAVIKVACATWSAAPAKAIDTFLGGFDELTAEQTAGLLDGIDLASEDNQEFLSKAWKTIVNKLEHLARIQTINFILAKGLTGPPEEPDRGLRLWIDALGKYCNSVLADAITQSDLNDPLKRRLWQQVARLGSTLGFKFFLDVIPRLVILSPIDETAAALFSDYDLVYAALGSTDNRADLSQRLMRVFTDAPTKTVKSYIAEWCKKLSGRAALSTLREEDLSEDDLSILNAHFPGATILKKILHRRESQ